MPKKAPETRNCLGWCGKKIPFHNASERYCPKCRAIKESRYKSMSKMETMTLQTSGSVSNEATAALLGD